MRWHTRFVIGLIVVIVAASGTPARSQGGAQAQARKFLASPTQVVAIRAGRFFDAKSGNLLNNQVVLIRGDRITDVGAAVPIPPDARVLDLSSATVLPGMIDAHVHVNTGGDTPAERVLIALANALTDLEAGFTTVLDMDSRGGFNTVDLRDAINAGLVQGPRMQVVGQSINQRAGNYYADAESLRFLEGFIENKNVNSPWLARAAVREAKLHGVDWIKIYTTQDYVGQMHMWKPDDTLVASPSLTLEEVEAIVDEAHRLGLRVACHTYGGEGMNSCLTAGVDAPNHLLELDDAGVKIMVQKKLPFVVTLDDLIGLEKDDLRDTGGRNSRLRLAEKAFKKAVAAGVPIVFGSGATSAAIPHGKQADQFKYYANWGLTPARALQTAYLPAATMLNYGWANQIGTIEKGKFADIIAVSGNPLADVSEMERVKFVMKGGVIVRNELVAAQATTAQRPDPNSLRLRGDRFQPLTYAAMTPAQKTMIDHLLSGPRAGADGPFNVLLRSPEMGDLAQQFGAATRFNPSMPRKLNELAIIITARYWTSQYEWQAHHRAALQAGLDPAIADAIAQGKRPVGMQKDEEAVYTFCSELLNTKQVSDRTFNAAKEAVGERGVVDLIGVMGWYNMVSMLLNTDRYPLPDGSQPELKPLQ